MPKYATYFYSQPNDEQCDSSEIVKLLMQYRDLGKEIERKNLSLYKAINYPPIPEMGGTYWVWDSVNLKPVEMAVVDKSIAEKHFMSGMAFLNEHEAWMYSKYISLFRIKCPKPKQGDMGVVIDINRNNLSVSVSRRFYDDMEDRMVWIRGLWFAEPQEHVAMEMAKQMEYFVLKECDSVIDDYKNEKQHKETIMEIENEKYI